MVFNQANKLEPCKIKAQWMGSLPVKAFQILFS
jgi:hypothetical protein